MTDQPPRAMGPGVTWMVGCATTFDTVPCPACRLEFKVGEDVVVRRAAGWKTGTYHPHCAETEVWAR